MRARKIWHHFFAFSFEDKRYIMVNISESVSKHFTFRTFCIYITDSEKAAMGQLLEINVKVGDPHEFIHKRLAFRT